MIKIEASLRLLASEVPRPPWYKRSLAQVGDYRFVDGASPFPRTTLRIQEQSPERTRGIWVGTWSVEFDGNIVIYLQKSYVAACQAKGLEFELIHVLQHEYVEAKLTISLARKKYPTDSPYIMAEKDIALGGKAHDETIRELDGISGVMYDKWLSKIAKFLGLR